MFFNLIYYIIYLINFNFYFLYNHIYRTYITFWLLNSSFKFYILSNFWILFFDLYINLIFNNIWYIILKKYICKAISNKLCYNIMLIYYNIFIEFNLYIVNNYTNIKKVNSDVLMKQYNYNLLSSKVMPIIDFILYKNFIKTNIWYILQLHLFFSFIYIFIIFIYINRLIIDMYSNYNCKEHYILFLTDIKDNIWKTIANRLQPNIKFKKKKKMKIRLFFKYNYSKIKRILRTYFLIAKYKKKLIVNYIRFYIGFYILNPVFKIALKNRVNLIFYTFFNLLRILKSFVYYLKNMLKFKWKK
jgi:hypothetical protein